MRELTDTEQRLAYRFAHLALPPDATACDPWCWHGDEDWRRYFVTREWDVAGLWVSVGGEQNHHGEITRWMHVGGDDRCSTSERAELIESLLAAGQLLDELTSGGPLRLAPVDAALVDVEPADDAPGDDVPSGGRVGTESREVS